MSVLEFSVGFKIPKPCMKDPKWWVGMYGVVYPKQIPSPQHSVTAVFLYGWKERVKTGIK